MAVLVGDSTLREKKLDIVETFLDVCQDQGIKIFKIIKRKIDYSQARYHKSANPNIRTLNDYLILFSV